MASKLLVSLVAGCALVTSGLCHNINERRHQWKTTEEVITTEEWECPNGYECPNEYECDGTRKYHGANSEDWQPGQGQGLGRVEKDAEWECPNGYECEPKLDGSGRMNGNGQGRNAKNQENCYNGTGVRQHRRQCH